MRKVLEHEEPVLAARCYGSRADAEMGLASEAPLGSIKHKEHLARAIEALDMAFDGEFIFYFTHLCFFSSYFLV